MPLVNVLDPLFYVDPWEAFRWLRDEAPVYWDPVQKLWAISRYDDIMAVERNGVRYSSFRGSRPHIDLSSDQSMINLDDPDHQALPAGPPVARHPRGGYGALRRPRHHVVR